jgi:hypothetical protein
VRKAGKQAVWGFGEGWLRLEQRAFLEGCWPGEFCSSGMTSHALVSAAATVGWVNGQMWAREGLKVQRFAVRAGDPADSWQAPTGPRSVLQ